ncbi:pleiotropic drug resistance protein 3-like isoform X4 [Quercus robur]|uniref:pleiotropic drug resistance protein 3-like isoform X4 n=1 Tax=Quercus robur TaxID=38942 RepID=UPI00216203CA|nr:pleiotropic drug resistance protein 3-like isoform X4 [Quercus robur]
MELTTIGKSTQSSFQPHASTLDAGGDSIIEEDEELELQWAAIERLPTFKRLRTSVFDIDHDNGSGKEFKGKRVTDVTKLGAVERHLFIEKLIKHIENDNLRLLQKLRDRIDRVNVKLPTVEVRYTNLFVDAKCEVVQGKPLPTLWNSIMSPLSVFTKVIQCNSQEAKINILKDVSGIIKPSRLTLLLGPPGCGKTTLLLALAGKLYQSLDVAGEISYNGYKLDEFIPQKTSAYISQHDLHLAEMTVRETIDFAARCQGVGSRADIMMEVSRREKEEGIVPDPDIDTYMKAISVEGQKRNLQTDYVLKILGLDICSDTMVGDALKRGISGGQKKRLTTGEMIVGPTKALFMDEISTGLDSSTTFQIVTCLQQLVHITDTTALVSLLQPAPETFDLFDEVILMAEGKIVYHGPRTNVLQFFEDCGFKCPERKGAADFLQEVISRKDQAQYWYHADLPYNYVSVDQFSQRFKASSLGQKLNDELSKPYDKSKSHNSAMSFDIYSLSKWEMFKACMARELLLMKRNSFVYIFKTMQLIITAFITMTVFMRTQTTVDLIGANYFLGCLFYTIVRLMTNGVAELFLTITRLPVVYKQRSLYLYPAWAYSIPASLMSYAEIGIALNEFLAPRWQKVSKGNMTIGMEVLTTHGLNFDGYFYWISLGALFGFTILFDIGFILALTYIKPPKISRAIISKKNFSQLREADDCNGSAELDNQSTLATSPQTTAETRNFGRLVLPFEPLTISFKDVQYFVDTPPEMREMGFSQKKLQLLRDITGAFRPGILTALMGVSGAGKTTLMDVLSGRKTGGTIEGDIRIGGYPKVQKTFARISGYCEQNDIHSPRITVKESVTYSAWLRLPPEIDSDTKARFVEEIIVTIELDGIKDSLVGIPGQSGLSTEQRKRLTIAVELVSNPSIIFMDEPTSGLDARAAAIVMRAVKNVVSTGRTTVCTIHQPSIDIFEAFDELILMKTGGQIIYSGILGHHSSKLIEYFEGIAGVPKIKNNYNPATWMLEVTSASVEADLDIDFSRIYKDSPLHRDTIELVRQLSEPQPGSRDLHFPTPYAQSGWVQFMACLWKQHLSYWRSPEYNLARLLFIIAAALLFGAVFWQKGKEINTEQDLFNIFGSMYMAVIFLGLNNCSTVLPHVATERTVLYREKFAGMYSPNAYSFAQVIMEIPYVILQTILYVALTYPAIGFYWSAYKVFWYFYATFCTILYYVYLGMLLVSMSKSIDVASILAVAIYTIFNIFSGFLMPGPKIPKWWVWCYWICPTSWSLNGLLTSQYGDIKKEILIFGELKTVGSFLEDYYGFRPDQLGLVAFVLIAYPIIYASLLAYCIGKLNFQRR